MVERSSARWVPWVAHASGVAGLAVGALFLGGLSVPPAQAFPDSRLTAFHTLFVGAWTGGDALPPDHDPDWLSRAEPGDVVVLSRGRRAWGIWSHVAVVVRAPADDPEMAAGELALVDASIHAGVRLVALERYAGWPRVLLLRASDDAAVRARIAARALAHRGRIFASAIGPGAPYTNCAAVAVDALASVGMDVGVTGWGMPDELVRSPVWLR